MSTSTPYILSQNIIPDLLNFCHEHGLVSFYLVADQNTYQVLGEEVEQAMRKDGLDFKTIIITGNNIHTDEHFLVQAMVEMAGDERVFVAVGSGTVTDITRFISHRSRNPFISIPTAPSVDGYTSTVAPMVVGHYKSPVPAQPPIAVFGNLPTLCSAPVDMIAAGLGDLLGKYTSLADWKLGHLLYNEPFNQSVYDLMKRSVDDAVAVIGEISDHTCDGISRLMDGLVGSGFGMLEFGDSRPASGSEHHIAHYWEIFSILEGKPAILHGAEVGVGTILSARRYQQLEQMSIADVQRCLNGLRIPDHTILNSEIEQGYGPISQKIKQIQSPLYTITQENIGRLKENILNHWDDIKTITREVPAPSKIIEWIAAAGGPTHPHQIGYDDKKARNGIHFAHYLRDRFTINRLSYWLQLPEDVLL